MKKTTLLNLMILAAASIFTTYSFAATSAPGPKPNCRVGTVAVVENGSWTCKKLGLKAQPGSSMPSTGGARPMPTTKPMTPNSVQVQKPDYMIMSISKVGGKPNQFGVQIKNIGKVAAHGGQLSGANMGSGGGSASTPMLPIKAGEFQFVFITFNNSSFNRGDRIRFHADSSNSISESNEGNNVKFYTYQ